LKAYVFRTKELQILSSWSKPPVEAHPGSYSQKPPYKGKEKTTFQRPQVIRRNGCEMYLARYIFFLDALLGRKWRPPFQK
jgi:hypothetical protein